MRHEDKSARSRRARRTWPRRAVVGFWIIAYAVGGGVLVARWEVLMARLARPPVVSVAAEGAPR